MMLDCTQACERMVEPLRMVVLERQAPSSITTPGPTTTLGPTRQPLPITADGSCRDEGEGWVGLLT